MSYRDLLLLRPQGSSLPTLFNKSLDSLTAIHTFYQESSCSSPQVLFTTLHNSSRKISLTGPGNSHRHDVRLSTIPRFHRHNNGRKPQRSHLLRLRLQSLYSTNASTLSLKQAHRSRLPSRLAMDHQPTRLRQHHTLLSTLPSLLVIFITSTTRK